jgi:DNA-binding transcriptional LysR family regulator
MQDLNDLYYYAQVVSHGGFAPAGRALGIPKSKLSRRVAALEQRLNVRLIERSTRRFSVTAVGQEFYRHCQAVIAEAEGAEEAAARMRGEPRGLVRLSVPVQFAQSGLARLMPKFLAAHPLVRVQMVVTNRRVDLIEEGVDVALRVRLKLDSDAAFMVRVLGRDNTLLVASPEYVGHNGEPAHPLDLKDHAILFHGEGTGKVMLPLSCTEAEGGEASIEIEPRLAAGDFTPLLEAALAGSGIAFLPEMVCREHVLSGQLLRLLPQWTELQGIVHMVFTTRRGQLPAVSALIDFLAAELPAALGLKT